MTPTLDDVIAYLNSTLEIARFRDYAPNGLQVEANSRAARIVTAVSANLQTFEKAQAIGADLLVVHHGLIWGDGIASLVGPAAARVGYLFRNELSLAAYHLPLDDHPRLGNNAGLVEALDLNGPFEKFGNVKGVALGLLGHYPSGIPLSGLIERVCSLTGRQLPFSFGFGPEVIRHVGVATGAASDLLLDAKRAGCDAFITGELAERASELARELGIHLIAMGHYASEVFGPKRLAADLKLRFPAVETHFVDVPSPL